MKDNTKNRQYADEMYELARDIFDSGKLEINRDFIQHGTTSLYCHMLAVCRTALKISAFCDKVFKTKTDRRSIARGALLHDYFLYDWHEYAKHTNWHGYTHAFLAFQNAGKDFELNAVESDIITKHMFPLNISSIPRFHETAMVCLADKCCSWREVFRVDVYSATLKRINEHLVEAGVRKE